MPRIHVGDRVSMYSRGRKGIWTACFAWKGKHRRKTLGTRNKKLALRKAVKLDVLLAEEKFDEPASERKQNAVEQVSLEAARDQFIQLKEAVDGRRRKTITKYKSTLRLFIEFCTERSVKRVSQVSLALFDDYRAKRLIKASQKTVHNESVMLKAFFGYCAECRFIFENPLAKQKFRAPRYEPLGGPTLQQVNQVLKHFRGKRQAAIAILAFSGMRAGECQRLRVDLGDVDLENNWLHIVSRDKGDETKTGDSWKVPIHPRLRKIIEPFASQAATWLLTANPSRKYPEGGHQMSMKHLNEDFQDVLVKLGVKAGKKNKGFTIHSLRAFFKTHCINTGTPEKIVDKWQNHKGDRGPRAADTYYRLADDVSQEKMRSVPFDET